MGASKLIVITGPTASGKTAVSIRLCQRLQGEVISCDSMQVYRGMDIGTAKPTLAEQQGVAHHMIDVVSPKDDFTVSDYRQMAGLAVGEVLSHNHVPVLCGGTGLYIDALTRAMSFSGDSDEALRQELHQLADEPGGKVRLHRMLLDVDPPSAERLHPNDVRRVIRAIEIFKVTGHTMTWHMAQDNNRPGDWPCIIFALQWSRDTLYERIDRRVDDMFAAGLVNEVQTLIDHGVPLSATSMQALGYKEVAQALQGECSMDEAMRRIKIGTRHYAKRQMTWLRRDGRCRFIDAENHSADDICAQIIEEIKNEPHEPRN